MNKRKTAVFPVLSSCRMRRDQCNWNIFPESAIWQCGCFGISGSLTFWPSSASGHLIICLYHHLAISPTDHRTIYPYHPLVALNFPISTAGHLTGWPSQHLFAFTSDHLTICPSQCHLENLAASSVRITTVSESVAVCLSYYLAIPQYGHLTIRLWMKST